MGVVKTRVAKDHFHLKGYREVVEDAVRNYESAREREKSKQTCDMKEKDSFYFSPRPHDSSQLALFAYDAACPVYILKDDDEKNWGRCCDGDPPSASTMRVERPCPFPKLLVPMTRSRDLFPALAGLAIVANPPPFPSAHTSQPVRWRHPGTSNPPGRLLTLPTSSPYQFAARFRGSKRWLCPRWLYPSVLTIQTGRQTIFSRLLWPG
ncbi:hypothetical protein C8R44DRAFT_755035 [Mycena epipterygia]|nr:hypothetical protein C8R44DRAFT_755035 [Mycena epipterygia]